MGYSASRYSINKKSPSGISNSFPNNMMTKIYCLFILIANKNTYTVKFLKLT